MRIIYRENAFYAQKNQKNMTIMQKKYHILPVIALVLLLTPLSVLAQNGDNPDIYLGGGLAYGEKISELGIQANGYYIYSEDIRFGGDFIYWLVDSPDGIDNTWVDINANAHYLFYEEGELTLYGIGSLGLHYWSSSVSTNGGSYSASNTDLALGIGAGAEYDIDAVKLFAEPRLFLTGLDQFALSFGVRFGI